MKTFYKILGLATTLFGMSLAFVATASAATLSLSPASQNLNVGDTLTVNVLLDTGGSAIDGVDIQALNYNPYYLQLQDSDGATSGVQVTAGSLMSNTLANSADTTNGKVVFSQVTSGGTTYNGNGTLATLNFKALVAGTATLSFTFTAGATTDTNVASAGNDILTSVTNGSYVISNPAGAPQPGTPTPAPSPSPSPSPTPSGSSSGMKLVNASGTYYFIFGGMRHGVTNPGMLASYGFTFAMGKTASSDDLALPEGVLLTPGDGALVKSKEDPTVYLISGQQRYGFVSADVFSQLGFKFSSVLVVTNPELQALPLATNLDNGTAAHLAGLDILRNGTVYWLGSGQLYGYPSLDVYNSWHIPNDFSAVVPANDADMALPAGGTVSARILD